MSLDLRPVVASVRESVCRLQPASSTDTSIFALTANLLDVVADEMDVAAVMAAESDCDRVTEYRQTWTAAVLLARKVLGGEEAR